MMQVTLRSAALENFDWSRQDYSQVNRERLLRLALWAKNPRLAESSREYYRNNIAQFIEDVGYTSDPRNALQTPPKPVIMPFVLFEKQREFVSWVLELARNKQQGICEKSRDCGISWLTMCLIGSLCLFNSDMNIGVGSAKEDKIDRSGDPDTLFHKLRVFLDNVPVQFRGGYDPKLHSAHMRIKIPATNSTVVGEAGRTIGRGGRTSLYVLDESAFIEDQEAVDASLASNTDCRIDISSVRGMANRFAIKRHSGKFPVFTFRHTDDPRKGPDYLKRMSELLDPVTLASEILIDYKASVEGSLIPAAWIEAAIDADIKLRIPITGIKHAGLDIADEGKDRCAFAGRHGILLQHLESWSGKGLDLYRTVARAFNLCDVYGYRTLSYDGDGVGAGARGCAVPINEARLSAGKPAIKDEPFRGSASPVEPDRTVPGTQRKNVDMFANWKAMAHWYVRMRFQQTYFAVVEGRPVDADSIISIRGDLPDLGLLVNELGQPTYSVNAAGRIVVDKAPDGAPSPNLSDAVMIAFAPGTRALRAAQWNRMSMGLNSLGIALRR